MNQNPLASLSGDATVYRAALDVTWLSPDKTTVESEAFYRRTKGDEAGVSIGATPYAHRAAGLKNPIDGIIAVSVGCVREVGIPESATFLDVEINNYPHGNITNVPFKVKRGAGRKLADRIASLLARNCARVHEVFDPPHN